MLESLKYIQEIGKTSNFISDFRKLCRNAEINNEEEQKKYFYKSLLNCDFVFELIKRKEKNKSMNDIFKEFEEIVTKKSNKEANLVRNDLL